MERVHVAAGGEVEVSVEVDLSYFSSTNIEESMKITTVSRVFWLDC